MRVVARSAELLPPAARYLADHAPMTFDVGSQWLLEVQLDGGAQHTVRDVRPTLPVVIRHGPARPGTRCRLQSCAAERVDWR